jgi:uncharacterized protein YecT (DUF1311 family)
MWSCGTNLSRFATILLLLIPLFSLARQRQPRISEDEIKKHFSKSPDCEGVDIDNLEYFDFVGDGNEEAVVVASTCATGTAGPDVHAVLSRQPDGSLTELKIPEPSEQPQARLFGRVFYELSVENGLLVETYHDQSGRGDPLVIKLRWNSPHKAFQTVEVKAAPRYKASFDCAKAKTEVENAICSSSTVAALDLRVDERYKSWLDNLSNADSDILLREQRDWLRKRNLVCGNDAETIDCLQILYRERLLELEHFKHLHP